jgi:exopolysaccharide biosynthesis protein
MVKRLDVWRLLMRFFLRSLRTVAPFALLGLCVVAMAADPLQYTTRTVKVNGISASLRVLKVRINQVRFVVGLAYDNVGATEDMAAIAKRNGAIAAINGCFFEAYIPDERKPPLFLLVHQSQTVNWSNMGTVLAFGPNGEARMAPAPGVLRLIKSDDPFWGHVEEAMGCGPRLVTDGQVTVDPPAEGFRDQKVLSLSAGRSAIGFTADGQMLLVVSRGTIGELAAQMQALGAVQAMDLDGGASSGLWLRGKYLVKPGRLLSNILMITPITPAVYRPKTMLKKRFPYATSLPRRLL